jgi:hypothetical protein
LKTANAKEQEKRFIKTKKIKMMIRKEVTHPVCQSSGRNPDMCQPPGNTVFPRLPSRQCEGRTGLNDLEISKSRSLIQITTAMRPRVDARKFSS